MFRGKCTWAEKGVLDFFFLQTNPSNFDNYENEIVDMTAASSLIS